MYLLDTNVISELRKAESGKADKNVVTWANSIHVSELFLSVITILELETGILLSERRDPKQGKMLRAWFDTQILPVFADRTLDLDITVATRCAKLHVPDPRSYRDSIISATALVHDMTVVTKNVRDFEYTGVKILNPWKS